MNKAMLETDGWIRYITGQATERPPHQRSEGSIMKVRIATEPQPCAVIVGEFVFGPVRCGILTDMVEDETGDDWPVCGNHSTLDSGFKGIPVSDPSRHIARNSGPE